MESVLGFYLWGYSNVENTDYILGKMRESYPTSDLVISSDAGEDFSAVSKKYNAVKYIHGTESHGYPQTPERYGWSDKQALLWFSRLYEACQMIKNDYVMLMEEDILIKERFRFPAVDLIMIPKIKNPISSVGMKWVNSRGGRTDYPYYSAGGGSIINRKKFMQAYEKHIEDLFQNYESIFQQSFSEGVAGWGWNDSLICVLMYADNSSVSTELPILETGNENDPAPIIHKFKKYYKQKNTSKTEKIKIKNKNVFLSCAYTNSSTLSIFDRKTRFNQLLKTFESCSNVKDHINIVSEGSSLSKEELAILQKLAIVLENPNNTAETNLNKSQGALMLWIKALEQIEISEDSDVYFLSGRYQLTDKFSTEDFQIGDFVFRQHWYSDSRGGWYGLQLFKVSGKSISIFKTVLEHSKKYVQTMDLECSIYLTFSDMGIVPSEIPMVNCIGWFGPNGKESIH